MEILLDASAIMAVIVDEPERDEVIELTKNTAIVSPNVVSFEVANALTKMMKRKIIDGESMINAYRYFKRIAITPVEVDVEKALEIAWEFNIYAYDAYYLETAKRLNLPLLTFDSAMGRIGNEMGINILGGR
jgi:predicted nucleic acid-binding protein